ncbi:MAG: OmpA family protein [Phycisphaerae bacterium]|nr:OmpA family protein [Phycisphaerae bacterium]
MYRTIVAAALFVTGICGCTSPSSSPSPTAGAQPGADAQRTCEQERDSLRQQLASERAQVTSLQQRANRAEEEARTARAQIAAVNDHAAKVAQHNQELQAIIEQTKSGSLKRPELPASPLPANTDAALQALAGKYGDRVWYERGRGAISFANDRLFESGSDAVRADAQAALHELAQVLAAGELAEYEMIVVGHTDAAPITKAETLEKHPTNWHLSVHRAIAVKDVLAKGGVPAARLGVMGYADKRPLGDDAAKNRRVEIFIVPQGGVQAFEPVRRGR